MTWDFWVEKAITFLSIAAPITFGAWKLSRDRRDATEARQEEHRLSLRVKIYEQIAEALFACSSALVKTGGRIGGLPFVMAALKENEAATGVPQQSPRFTFEELHGLHFAAVQQIINVMQVIEKYEIAIAGFEKFKGLASQGMEKVEQAYSHFVNKVLPYQTRPLVGGGELARKEGIRPGLPTEPEIAVLKKLGGEYQGHTIDLGGYLFDLRVEAQNHLLGALFERRVQPRQPQDRRIEVFSVGSDTALKLPDGVGENS